MDSEHRHQLQQNDLAQASMKMANFFEVHGTKIVGAIAVLVVAAIIWAVWANSANDSQVEAWTALSTAIQSNEPSAETFGSVADRFSDSPAGAWARLQEAELAYETGLPLMFRDREAGTTDLERAEKAFQQVLDNSSASATARERALFGLAKTKESLCTGDTEPVIAVYRKLLQEFPTTIYKTYADERIKALETDGAKAFYAWWGEQKPRPSSLPRPADGGAAPAATGNPFGEDLELPAPAPAEKPAEAPAQPEGEAATPEKSDEAAATPAETPAEAPATEPAKP